MKRFLTGVLLAAMLLIVGCSLQQVGTEDASVPTLPVKKTVTTTLPCLYYDEQIFKNNLQKAAAYGLERPPVIAVSPHYNQTMFFTTSILQEAKDLGANYQTVVILAPNHSGLGKPVQLANQPWQTPFGVCDTDQAWASMLCRDADMKAEIDNQHLVEDHAASTLIPYVHYFFPEAKVVPLLLGRGTALPTLQRLATYLADLSGQQEVLVLGSIDFSHYLTYEDALAHDQTTMAATEQRDYATISQLDNGYLDSPETLMTLLYLTEHLGDQPLALQDYYVQRGAPPKDKEGYSYLLYLLEQPNHEGGF